MHMSLLYMWVSRAAFSLRWKLERKQGQFSLESSVIQLVTTSLLNQISLLSGYSSTAVITLTSVLPYEGVWCDTCRRRSSSIRRQLRAAGKETARPLREAGEKRER